MDKTMMKYISAIAAATIALTVCCPETEGQDYTAPAVTISKEKVKVNGRTCYTHIVLEKQTLYSISKAYNVSIDEIYEYNPGLKENGLKKNSIIVIPMSETAEAAGTDKNAKDAAGSSKTRQTKKGEDSSATEDKTAKGNKAADNKSTAAGNMEDADEPEDENAIIHTVRWYEDLESIAQKYGVSADAIYAANNLKSKTLKSRQKLIIPQGAAAQRVSSQTAAQSTDGISSSSGSTTKQDTDIATNVTDNSATGSWTTAGTVDNPQTGTTAGATNSSSANSAASNSWAATYSKSYLTKNETNVALLLPLKASSKPNSGSFDFYCGALLAARDMGMEGVNVNLNVKDISGANTFDRDFFNSNDIIIGPVAPSDIASVFTSATNAGVKAPYIISPLDPKASSLLASHSSLIQVPSPHSAQYRELTAWITEEFAADDRLIVISEKTSSPAANVKQLKKAIAESGLPAKEISYNILEGRKIIDNLREQMSKEGTSRIIIASESEAFVNDVLRNLNLLIHESYDIVLYGLSRFRSFDTIEVENFHNTNMRVCLPYYIDYESPAVMEFVKKYRALFKTEPTQFAFQGYDVAKYFLKAYSEYGDGWIDGITEGRTDMLQASFDFRDNNQNGNGYENNAVRRVVYGPDYSIRVLNAAKSKSGLKP